MTYRAFIFDLDGTLVDSMPWHNRAWLQVIAQEGIDIDEEQFILRATGMAAPDLIREFIRPGASDAEVSRLCRIKWPIFRDLYRPHLELLPGAREFLIAARQLGLRLAIATSASPETLDLIVGTLDLRPRFDTIVVRSQVAQGKPHPDIFIKAADLLGVPPAQSLVFEDALAGIEAAHAANMDTCLIQTIFDNSFVASCPFPRIVKAVPDYANLRPGDLLKG
jgi:beta-phosphoglucomutase